MSQRVKNRNALLTAFNNSNGSGPQSGWTEQDWQKYINYNPQAVASQMLADTGLSIVDFGDEALNMTTAEQQNRLNAYNQWYNSEVQSAARMRAAGLNPDLVGLEDANSADVQASSPADVQAANAASIQAQTGKANAVVSGISTALDAVISAVGAYFGVNNQILSNDVLDTQIYTDLRSSDMDFLESFKADAISNPKGAPERISSMFLGDRPRSHRERISYDRRKRDIVNRVKSWLANPAEAREYAKSLYESQEAKFKADAFSKHKDEIADEIDEGIVLVYEVGVESNIQKKLESKYNQAYFIAKDAAAAAGAENSHNVYNQEYYGSLDGFEMAGLTVGNAQADIEAKKSGAAASRASSVASYAAAGASDAAAESYAASAESSTAQAEYTDQQTVIAKQYEKINNLIVAANEDVENYMNSVGSKFDKRINAALKDGNEARAARLIRQKFRAMAAASNIKSITEAWRTLLPQAIQDGAKVAAGAAAYGASKGAGAAAPSGEFVSTSTF